MENVTKIPGSIRSTSFFKFENMNDYVSGLTSLMETFEVWKESADPGFTRNVTVTQHDSEMKLEVELEVTPHDI